MVLVVQVLLVRRLMMKWKKIMMITNIFGTKQSRKQTGGITYAILQEIHKPKEMTIENVEAVARPNDSKTKTKCILKKTFTVNYLLKLKMFWTDALAGLL